MSRFFLGLGALLVLVLTAALVVPLLVDWSVYRETFERQTSALLGRPVRVSGATDLRLLPTPTVRFEGLSIGEADAPLFTADRFEVVLSIAPFLKGEIEVLELTLERPVLRLPLGGNGEVALPPAHDRGAFTVDLGAISVAEAHVSDGAIVLVDQAGQETRIADQLNSSLSAPSALGPWRLDAGSLTLPEGEIVSFRATTGRVKDGAMRLRLSAFPATTPVLVEADGLLRLSGQEAGYQGQAVLRASADGGFRLASDFALTPSRLRAENLVWSLAAGEGAGFELSGHADIVLASPARFEAVLSSRQVDLDRIMGGGPEVPLTPAQGFEGLRAALAALPPVPAVGNIYADVPAVVLGGAILRNIGVDIALDGAGGLRILDMEAELPGDSVLSGSGELRPGQDRFFEGHIGLASARAATFIGWARQEEMSGSEGLRQFDLAADLLVNAQGAALRSITGTLDDTPISGSMVVETVADAAPRLALTLDAGALDADLVLGVAGLMASSGPDAAPMRIEADIAASRLTVGGVFVGGIDTELTYENGRADITRLAIGDAGGARLDMTGALEGLPDAPSGQATLHLDAEDSTGFLTLARRLLPDSRVIADLARHAALYSPARLDFSFEGALSNAPSHLALNGTLGSTTIAADAKGVLGGGADAASAPLTLTLDARGDSAFQMLSQSGLALYPVGVDSEGVLDLQLEGRLSEGATLDVRFSGLDGHIAYQGKLLRRDETLLLDGRLEGQHPDLSTLGLMAGLSLPVLPGGIDLTFSGALSGSLDRLALARLEARLLDARMTGFLERRQPARGPVEIAGRLDADGIDLELLGLALMGPEALDPTFGSVLPAGLMSPQMLTGTRVALHLTSPRARITDTLFISDLSGDLDLGEEGFQISNLEGQLAGGRLGGRFSLLSNDLTPILRLRATLERARAEELLWQDQGQPVMTGALSLSLMSEGQGQSLSALASSLSGEAGLVFEDGTIRGLSPAAFVMLVRGHRADVLEDDAAVEAAFAAGAASGSLGFSRFEGALTLTGGVLRANSMVLEAAEARLRGSSQLDLASMALRGDFLFEPAGDVQEALGVPGVGIALSGTLDEPTVSFDVTQLTAALNVQRLEAEIEKVEALNAEILERERLVRLIASSRNEARRITEAREAEARAQAEEDARARAAATTAEQPRGRSTGASGLPSLEVIEVAPLPTPPVVTPQALPAPGTNQSGLGGLY